MSYAIISVGGKQYRVREGERLTVDRLAHGEGKTFQPTVLLVGGNGETTISPTDVTVTARVVANTLGEKIRIGKYKPKSGYRKHTGFRASLTQIEIESIGGAKRARAKKQDEAKPKAEAAAPAEERVKGMPSGYEELTVAEIKTASAEWNRPMLEAALEYEQAHAKRKGALAALESALEAKEES
ncbi:MAG TPA: 50S ribosomal protein L21 [Gaiellaceae bacterium]|nr:50S ribosomal protein L21 [Gaiellaceae bacterium]